MNSVPREVNGKWYPVPCPDWVSLGLSFPSEETCAAFCEVWAEIEDERALEVEKLEERHADAMNDLEEDVSRREYDSGFEDGIEEGLHRAEVAASKKPA